MRKFSYNYKLDFRILLYMAKKTESNISTKTKMPGPYDIIKLMFTDVQGFDKLSDIILERNSFMINRIFAIQFPAHAQIFNTMGMKGSNTVKAWRIFGLHTFGGGRVPSFVYTKGAKSTTTKKQEKQLYTKDEINQYCEHYNISHKDFEEMQEFIPDILKDKMTTLIKQTTESGIKQQFNIEK